MTRLLRLLLKLIFILTCCNAAQAASPKVSAGWYHTLAVKADGTLLAWGTDLFGQLGQGRPLLNATPSQTNKLPPVTKLVSGPYHTLALGRDGTVWAWGSDMAGELGDGGNSFGRGTPVTIPGLSNIVELAAGLSFGLALKSDGTVWAWGRNDYGQLGDGTVADRAIPVQVTGLTGVVGLAAGGRHALALKGDGTVWAWGDNTDGQLGDGTKTRRTSPVQIAGLTDVRALAARGDYTLAAGLGAYSLALKSDGSVWAWGDNAVGQLGDGTATDRSRPAQIAGLSSIVKLVAGDAQGLALKSDGAVFAWGTGLLGDSPDEKTRATPVRVAGLSDIVSLAAGAVSSHAVKSDGSVWAWGYNTSGQLGDGSLSDRSLPVQISSGMVAVAAGSLHTLALGNDGSVWAWGNDIFSQLGSGFPSIRPTPVPVAGITGVVGSAAGQFHSLAMTSDGSVFSWGSNQYGQLGLSQATGGSDQIRSAPARVTGLAQATSIAAGYMHSLALTADGRVWAWGENSKGQLGDATMTNRPSPVRIGSLTEVIQLAAGARHSLALRADGSVWAWGHDSVRNYGNVPIAVAGLTGVISVAAGDTHSLAIRADGSVWAWGNNQRGQLGIGSSYSQVTTPTQVPGLTGVVAVAGGGGDYDGPGQGHTLALKSDGSVWAWGDNWYGQLGDGTTSQHRVPVKVPGLGDVAALAAGNTHSVTTKHDGSVLTWGLGEVAQLGDGTLAQRRSPVLVINRNGDGFLSLNADTLVNAPRELSVPFFVVASGVTSGKSAEIVTTTKFNEADVGKQGSVFITAKVPAASLASIPRSSVSIRASRTAATSTSGSMVLVQLTPSGWQQVTSGQLIPYTTGVLGDQLAAQTILNNADTTNLKGAEFCLGYGTSDTEMTTAARMRTVATISDPNTTGTSSPGCLPQTVSSNCLFNWAERIYPELFSPGGSVPATYDQYYYRYYSGTGNYLATATDDYIYLLGPVSANAILKLAPMSDFLAQAGCSQ